MNKPATEKLITTLESRGNSLTEEHRCALAMLIGTFTEMAIGARKGRWAFGLPTGMGKTSAIVAWCAQLIEAQATHISVAISASKVEALCELKRELIENGVPKEKIGLLHNKIYSPAKVEAVINGAPDADSYASEPSEGEDRQIMLVTHQRVRNSAPELKGSSSLERFNTYRGRPRDLLIYDESLIVSDSGGIPIRVLRAALGSLERGYSDVEKYTPAISFLRDALDAIDGDEGEQEAPKDRVVNLPKRTEAELAIVREALSDRDVKLFEAARLASIAHLPIRVVSDGQGGAVWYQLAVPAALENILILDASTPIRRLVKADRTITDVEDHVTGLPQVHSIGKPLSCLKDFSEVTVHQMYAGGGRDTVGRSFNQRWAAERKLVQATVDVIKGVPQDDGVLVFVYKTRPGPASVDFRGTLTRDLASAGVDQDETIDVEVGSQTKERRPRINILTWGQETSLNRFGYCKHVILCGVLQRSSIDLVGAYLGQSDHLDGEISSQLVNEIQRSEVCHLIYQALSRGSCRFIDDGKARPMQAWIIHKDPRIQETLMQAMPGAQWCEWRVDGVSQNRTTDRTANTIIDHLKKLEDQGVQKISVRQLKIDSGLRGVPTKTFSRARSQATDGTLWELDGRSLVRAA